LRYDLMGHMGRGNPSVIATSSSCARPKSSLSLGFPLYQESSQVVANPCWKLALPDVISAYPSPRVWNPYPGCSCGAFTRFFPQNYGPSQQSNPVGAQHNPYYSNFSMGEFRGCSHSLMFKPVDLLATQIAPTAANISFLAEQPWLLHPNTSRFVTSPRPGYANRPIRATDGKEDLHLSRFAALSAIPRPVSPVATD
jgi:hypothetical protein